MSKGFTFIILTAIGLSFLAYSSVSEEVELNQPKLDGDRRFIVAGQSNAQRCDWRYFKKKAGVRLIKIAAGGASIDSLIRLLDSRPERFDNMTGILFVHGEADSKVRVPPKHYIEQVELYRQLISDKAGRNLPLHVSTVGYRRNDSRYHYDLLRQAVIDEAKSNANWVIAFNEAQYFIERGMLVDNVHFTAEGCEVMMDAMVNSIYSYK